MYSAARLGRRLAVRFASDTTEGDLIEGDLAPEATEPRRESSRHVGEGSPVRPASWQAGGVPALSVDLIAAAGLRAPLAGGNDA